MSHSTRFLVAAAGLFGRGDARIELRSEVRLADLELSGHSAVVDGRLEVDLVLERTGSDPAPRGVAHGESVRGGSEGVLVTGSARGRWSVPCRRCLEPAQGDLSVEISELFETDPNDETWALREAVQEEVIDLGPMLREVALLSLPFAPLCRAQCRGPAPDRFPTGPTGDEGSTRDSRWSGLDELTFDG